MPGAKYELQRICEECGATFLAKNLDSRYCSKSCINKAYKKRKKEKAEQERLNQIRDEVEDTRNYISVPEATAMFGICRDTIYRLIRLGELPHINLGKRLIRIDKNALLGKYGLRAEPVVKEVALPKLYSLEPEDCYTIGEVTEKYKVSEKTVYDAIRKYGIPMRPLGKSVYVPKSEIDKLFKTGKMV